MGGAQNQFENRCLVGNGGPGPWSWARIQADGGAVRVDPEVASVYILFNMFNF